MGMFLRRGPAKAEPDTVDITLSGATSGDYAYIEVNGTKYVTARTVAVPIGSTVTVTVGVTTSTSQNTKMKITMNGKTVATGESGKAITQYSFVANTSAVCAFKATQSMIVTYYTCDITTS